jgi:hypothetical protein
VAKFHPSSIIKTVRALRATGKAHAQQATRRGLVVPKAFKTGVSSTTPAKLDPAEVYRGFRSQSLREAGGPLSILGWGPQLLAEKMMGKKRVRKAIWKHVSEPALRADIAAGHVFSKTPLVGKKLFRKKEHIPVGKGLQREVERSSALAPFEKVRDLAEPVLIGVGLEKGVNKAMGHKDSEKNASALASSDLLSDKGMREKIASKMLLLHEENKGHRKRAHALQVLFKQAELGVERLPNSYSELEVKLASLQNQDLVVLEKALELAAGNIKVGELATQSDLSGGNASEQFQAALLGEEEFS